MLADDDRKKAGALISNLLDKQSNMSSADPFALMKELTTQFEEGNNGLSQNYQSGNFKQLIQNPTQSFEFGSFAINKSYDS